MEISSTLSSLSGSTSPSSCQSSQVEPLPAFSPTPEDATMACAQSMTEMSTSLDSNESPKSVVDVLRSGVVDGEPGSTTQSPKIPPRLRLQPELQRIKELEQKRLALRHQRFSLEQRLYEFCGKHAESESEKPTRHVLDMAWKDKSLGVRIIYSGPVNKLDEPDGPDGILKFSDGQVYRGHVRKGLRDGAGTNRWADGQDYTGEWKHNSRNGRGTHTWPDGRKVAGEWQGGHLHGKVYFSWPNGATFDGSCRMGKKHGRGVHTWADGRVFSGNFENGKEHGFGTLTFPDSVKYRGQFQNGAKHGYGIQLWKTRTYDGEWVNNKPHGQGRVVWSNGATYTGQFLDGKYHGLGVYVWPSGKKFVGRWENGVKNGHGLYTWPSGKKYDGEYKDGQKHGYGRMLWADGQMYCGGWRENKRFGRGIQTDADGTVIHCGQWKDDEPIGEKEPVPNHIDEMEFCSSPLDLSYSPSKQSALSQCSGQTSGEGASTRTSSMISPKRYQNSGRRIASPDQFVKGEGNDLSSPTDEIERTTSYELRNGTKCESSSLVERIAPTRLIL